LKEWRSVKLYEHFNTNEICHREAANLCKSGEPFLYQEPHLFKNRNNTTVGFQILKWVGAPII
jgi:hypothetical protein